LDSGPYQRASEEAITRLRRRIDRGQQRGELSDAFDSHTLATALRSLANGTITHWLYDDTSDPLVARMRDAAEVVLSPVETPRRRRKGGSG
jgi:hypothetical protein